MLRAIFLAMLLAVPAWAEGRRMLTEEEARDWQAVGRVNIAGEKFCTGALIAPDQVLTAAHCVFSDVSRRLYRPDRLHFVAGYRLQDYTAHRQVRRIMVHRSFDPGRELSQQMIMADIAVLELAEPIHDVRPFEREVRPRAGDDIAVVSYARDRPEAPSIQEPCETIAVDGRFIVMDCDVTFGASGSPVFTIRNGRPRISSVVSAIGTRGNSDQQVAYGAALDDGALDSVLRDMVHGDADRGMRRLGGGSISEQLGRQPAQDATFSSIGQ
ncbi:trypsin-like serine peptidase [Pontivivens ytuae]|uniref:Serine protease n=1 Tax=Pontivivens ytuae TaxID=2789856 RepID=A0A7S9QC53_9RHOB|nr:trypsin-like serine protease [Pontivivens ytuae]QPH53032.1 trypsin-like serine protease [Pontivivens ytuae]